MPLEDTLLEPEEAEALTSQMHKLIKSDVEEPDHSRRFITLRMSPEYQERQKENLKKQIRSLWTEWIGLLHGRSAV